MTLTNEDLRLAGLSDEEKELYWQARTTASMLDKIAAYKTLTGRE